MSLMRYVNPFEELEQIQRELDRFFGDGLLSRFFGRRDEQWYPAVELRETDKEYQLMVDLPGINKEDVEIRIEDNLLTITGERKFERDEKKENIHFVERRYGRFTRSFTLPSNANPDKITAEFKDGVLHVTIPKRAERKGKKITIK